MNTDIDPIRAARKLASLLHIHARAIATAQERGQLTFDHHKGHPAWRYGDAEIGLWRRLDGNPWPHGGKVDTVGGGPAWHRLFGIAWLKRENRIRAALLCEGSKDAMMAHHLAHIQATLPGVAILCAAGSETRVDPEDARATRGKRLLIFADADAAGRDFADKAAAVLAGHGATVTIFNFVGLVRADGEAVKDLADTQLSDLDGATVVANPHPRAITYVSAGDRGYDTEAQKRRNTDTQKHEAQEAKEGGKVFSTEGVFSFVDGLIPEMRGQTNTRIFEIAQRIVRVMGWNPPQALLQAVAVEIMAKAGANIDPKAVPDVEAMADLLAYKVGKVKFQTTPFEVAWQRAKAHPRTFPELADRPALSSLFCVCVELAALSARGCFSISSRDASRVGGAIGPGVGAARLGVLVRIKYLEIAKVADVAGRKATEYRLGPRAPRP